MRRLAAVVGGLVALAGGAVVVNETLLAGCGASLCPGDSLNAAYQAAPIGVQTIFTLGAGEYGDQTIVNAPGKETAGVGPHVIFEPASGAVITAGALRLGSNVESNDGPDHLTARGFKLRGQLFVGGNDANDIVVEDISSPGFYFNGAQNLTSLNGNYGPAQAPGVPNSKVDGNPANANIKILGGAIHDYTFGPSCFPTGSFDCHGEGLFVSAAGPGFVIDGVRFWGNEIYNVFMQPGPGAAPNGCLIQNNWFGRTQNSDGAKRGTSLTWGTSNPPSGCLIRFNSFAPGERMDDEVGASFTNTRILGNRFGSSASCLSGMVFSYNVWTSGTCSATDRAEATFNYVNSSDGAAGDYHLTGGVAVGLVTATSADASLAGDFDGQARSAPRDAGSDEMGAVDPPPPTTEPPPTTTEPPPACPGSTLTLTVLAQTTSTITLGWTPPVNATGYRFSRSDQAKRTHTWDPSRSSVKFGKGAECYLVEALEVGASGGYGG